MKTDVTTFMSRWILLRIRNVSDKSCRHNQTRMLCSITVLRKSCPLWDNVQKYGRSDKPQIKIWRMPIACCIPKTTGTYLEWVILITFHGNNGYAREHSLPFVYLLVSLTSVSAGQTTYNVEFIKRVNDNELERLRKEAVEAWIKALARPFCRWTGENHGNFESWYLRRYLKWGFTSNQKSHVIKHIKCLLGNFNAKQIDRWKRECKWNQNK